MRGHERRNRWEKKETENLAMQLKEKKVTRRRKGESQLDKVRTGEGRSKKKRIIEIINEGMHPKRSQQNIMKQGWEWKKQQTQVRRSNGKGMRQPNERRKNDEFKKMEARDKTQRGTKRRDMKGKRIEKKK